MMAEFSLKFAIPSPLSTQAARSTFFWTASGPSSFRTSLGRGRGALDPSLGRLGPVRAANVDLVRLAATVYAADRSVRRKVGQVNWTSRSIRLTVPVLDRAAWTAIKPDLEELLGFLSGDRWELVFEKDSESHKPAAANPYPTAKRVVLLSGGADSAVGALRARVDDVEHVLVSHVGASSISPVQQSIAQQIRQHRPAGGQQHHQQILFTRSLRQPGGERFPGELSTRTRSFLFLALGLAVASLNEVPLWIPENGFASLNPPLGQDQLGSLSTRTTHPWFLSELSRLAAQAGAQAEIINPFASQTKGEMFRWVADQFGDDAGGAFLSSTNSCSNTNRRFDGMSAKKHCGVCFGCLMRRASFAAAGLKDSSDYVIDAPPSAAIAARLRKVSVLPSIEGFVTRGIGFGDIARMRLPTGYLPSAARELCQRGLAELELLL